MAEQRTIVIVTGCSGSGKSTALATFEDAGFYCVDNMPVRMMPQFLMEAQQESSDIAGWAFVMDMRSKSFLSNVNAIYNQLKQDGYHVRIVFLDADEQILARRYSQTRRHHPLGHHGSVLEAIQAEKLSMQPLRAKADYVIDTSHYSVHQLKFAILNIAQKNTAISGMAINVISFGFKYGTPPDADMIIDVRFLLNPYFVPELKTQDGQAPAIQEFVLKDPQTGVFLKKYLSLLDYLIPLYEKEGKAYLTISIGCTGGRHRSVVIAQQVYDHIRDRQSTVRLIHRDIRLA